MKVFIFFTVLLFLTCTAHCNSPHRVGVLYWSMNIPGQVAMRRGLENEAQKLNERASTTGKTKIKLLTYVAGDGEAGIERQIKQMYEVIDERVDLIIVQPTDSAALSRPLQKANGLKIPVIAYDQYINEGDLASYLTSDNYQAGYLDGEYVSACFTTKMKLRVILVEYPHVSSTVERIDGFLDALHDLSQPYSILRTYEAVEPKSGKLAGLSIIRDFPQSNSVDVVFCVNDGGGLSVVSELVKAKRTEIFVATIDGDPEAVNIIKRKGIIRIDSAQFCGALGRETMKAGYALLNNVTPPKHILVPTFPITKETVHRYQGWLMPIPSKFTKPWPSKRPQWDGATRVKKLGN